MQKDKLGKNGKPKQQGDQGQPMQGYGRPQGNPQQGDYNSKRTSNGNNDKKIQGYVPHQDKYKLQSATHTSTKSRKDKNEGQDKKSSKYSTQRDYDEQEPEIDDYSMSRSSYHYELSARADSMQMYGDNLYEGEPSQRSLPKHKMKEDQSMSSKNKYEKGPDYHGQHSRQDYNKHMPEVDPGMDKGYDPGHHGYPKSGMPEGGPGRGQPYAYSPNQVPPYPPQKGPSLSQQGKKMKGDDGQPRTEKGYQVKKEIEAFMPGMGNHYNYNYMGNKFKGYDAEPFDSAGKDKINELMSISSSQKPPDQYQMKRMMHHHTPYDYQASVGFPPHEEGYKFEKRMDKEMNSRSSKENSTNNKLMEIERMIKEREHILKELTAQETQLLEEKSKVEQENATLQNFFENRNLVDQNNANCERCCSIFNMSNQIGRNQLEQGLHQEILCFEKSILEINEQERPLLDKLIDKIGEMVREIHPDSALHIFGSFATGLCLPWSDIDILLEIKNRDPTGIDYLHSIDLHMDKYSSIVKTKKYIRGASYPVLKIECTEEWGHKRLDITIKDHRHTGVNCVALVREYITEYERILRPLVFVLKQMVYMANLNDPFTGGINSYGLILMVVAFLQSQLGHPMTTLTKDDVANNLGQFFLSFLNNYGNLIDYSKKDIRPSTIQEFRGDPHIQQFVARTEITANPQNTSLIIQDPLNRANNVTRTTFSFFIIRMMFSYSYFSVYQPCVCEISQLMNNPQAITEQTKIESAFNRKTAWLDNPNVQPNLVILTKILNSYKNLIIFNFVSKRHF